MGTNIFVLMASCPQAERRHSLGEQLTAEKGKLETTAAEVADGARSVETAGSSCWRGPG